MALAFFNANALRGEALYKSSSRRFQSIEKGKTIIIGPVWYMCLKTENCYLKIFVEIRVSEKVR